MAISAQYDLLLLLSPIVVYQRKIDNYNLLHLYHGIKSGTALISTLILEQRKLQLTDDYPSSARDGRDSGNIYVNIITTWKMT